MRRRAKRRTRASSASSNVPSRRGDRFVRHGLPSPIPHGIWRAVRNQSTGIRRFRQDPIPSMLLLPSISSRQDRQRTRFETSRARPDDPRRRYVKRARVGLIALRRTALQSRPILAIETTSGYYRSMTSKATFREQLRREIRRSGLSAYAIAKKTGIQQSQLSRFMSGERGLSLEGIDAVCELIGLQLVAAGKPERTRKQTQG